MRIDFKNILLIVIVVFSACKKTTKKIEVPTNTEPTETFITPKITGNFVSDGYSKRSEGYDWVSVFVNNTNENEISIKVRSRADQKKPTCTWDATAIKIDNYTYESIIDGKTILFQFKDNTLVIQPKNEADQGILYFYCSGGATVAGTYKKINEALDQTQIDQTQFLKVLNLQNVGFNVSSKPKNGNNQLSVFTFGLTNDFNETFNIGNNTISSAEVEDLNSDGSPELIVYVQSQDEFKKMTVFAFSVNNQKSMSQVYFQPTEENAKINTGYNGNDEFTLVETYLVQRFPIYEDGTKSNKIKQVQYKLVDGEALRRFEVEKQNIYSLD
ncbi:hypothetical protein [Aestuariibaculum sediminum]|uniref:PliI/PliC-like inhibitor of I-type lysozyme n=1 Tax=Aestuariibaculum sediminum TaxID=2770637 RepID=A0A8J6UBU7_9FLAO|nr:hypothetical protein [Aestuariibaculum sediminum]MBD0831434.1 hypothetical protein [Aestuariibaculum sediminum]